MIPRGEVSPLEDFGPHDLSADLSAELGKLGSAATEVVAPHAVGRAPIIVTVPRIFGGCQIASEMSRRSGIFRLSIPQL